ncbi:Deoxynucleotidyltransferase terminal-interacting protein 2 [Gaertneriomyces sp. JEL0708]|nr:Deoxynucleotidyltransferase terminal-interacting protein 2 [Gaertneriomyces sp. JEL0708]
MAADTLSYLEDLDSLLEEATESLRSRKEAHVVFSPEDEAASSSVHAQRKAATRTLFEQRLDSGFDKDALPIQKIGSGVVVTHGLTKEVTREIVRPVNGIDALLQGNKKEIETAGPKWFDLPATPVTPEIQRELHILKSRSVLDPKQHYKKGTMKEAPKFFQIGTILKDTGSLQSTKQKRGKGILEDLVEDSESRSYFKRKFLKVQESKMNFTRKGYKKKQKR